ncbi:MAG: ATP synthase F1 subunit delta [Acholeplasmataceae bacterium]|nr:ATP synthase F1 subunit delta [Acholeplasmataceae bacterium]
MTSYAKALHQLAVEQNKLDQINYNFEELKRLKNELPKWSEMMDSPMLDAAEKNKLIDELDFDVLFLSFLKTLSQKHLMGYLDEIHQEWKYLVRASQKIAHLNVYLAAPLSDEQELKLMEVLKPRFKGKTITLHKTIDHTLIGGIKVIYQGQSLDRSVARELEELFTTI